LIAKDEYSKYTLGALAELCGFSSRASFFRYFKKATGITPNEYIRSIGKTNE
jgi:AraC-like DNA-binding protein